MSIVGEEEEAYRILPGRADAGLILLCDHAENTLPAEYGTLGLGPGELQRHIAYDIGAAAITHRLSALTGAPAILSRFSRLLIDPNRGDDDPTLVMRLSDGAIVPGNRHLSEAERDRRIGRFWRPYHDAIERVLTACLEAGAPPVIFSVHSMTNVWKGVARPWHVAMLWNEDDRLARPMIEAFRRDPALIVGDNEPYHGGLVSDCLWQHARVRGLANVVIEYRQDLVADAPGQTTWAQRTADILCEILSCPQRGTSLRRAQTASRPLARHATAAI